jgi:hypothetical protein
MVQRRRWHPRSLSWRSEPALLIFGEHLVQRWPCRAAAITGLRYDAAQSRWAQRCQPVVNESRPARTGSSMYDRRPAWWQPNVASTTRSISRPASSTSSRPKARWCPADLVWCAWRPVHGQSSPSSSDLIWACWRFDAAAPLKRQAALAARVNTSSQCLELRATADGHRLKILVVQTSKHCAWTLCQWRCCQANARFPGLTR